MNSSSPNAADVSVLPWYMRWKLPPERPLYLIVGKRGSGKTLLATKMAIGRMRAGERVYANYPITLYRRRRYGFLWLRSEWIPHVRAGVVHSLLHTLDLRDCTIIIDEANLWASVREWQKIPSEVLSSWQQSRKGGASFIFTSQHESRVDKVIQQLTDWILICDRVPLVPRWVPLFRYHRTWLEDVSEVRRGRVYRGHTYLVPDQVLVGYATTDRVNDQQLEELRQYSKALRAGLDPDEIGVGIKPRSEPMVYDADHGEWLPWYDWKGGGTDGRENPQVSGCDGSGSGATGSGALQS